MPYFPQKVAFNRHESFHLRFGWLTKGFREIKKESDIFSKDYAIEALGVGKNMANSIRYWLKATKMVAHEPKGSHLVPSPLGENLLGANGWDPYLEDEGTIWLIHWLLATNPEEATSWYWFFNLFHKPEFTNQEAANALLDFVKENTSKKIAQTSIKKDCAVLLRSYTQSNESIKNIEEMLDSPLSLLRLISYSPATKRYQSLLVFRDDLPVLIFAYAVIEILHTRNVQEIPIEDLMYSDGIYPALGLVFRMTESDLLSKIEQLIDKFPDHFNLDETAGVHQLFYLNKLDPFDCLKLYYNFGETEEVA